MVPFAVPEASFDSSGPDLSTLLSDNVEEITGNECNNSGSNSYGSLGDDASSSRDESSRGRPLHPAWKYFRRVEQRDHCFKAECHFCKQLVKGRPKEQMKNHLATCANAKIVIDVAALYGEPALKSLHQLQAEQSYLRSDVQHAQELLTNFMISTGVPFSILHDKHFKKYISYLNSKLQLPSRHK